MLLNEEPRLRVARPDDWTAIATLLETAALPLDGAREHLSTFLVAEAAGALAGVAGVEVHGSQVLLRSVAVAPPWRGRGLGRRLVERVLAEAARRGFADVHLLTTTATDFFAGLGFAVVPRAAAPLALTASAEFQGACPASATLMQRRLVETAGLPADLPVAVIGAGPVGLSAVAHLLERGLPVVAFEAGPRVGAHLLDYGHVRLFSPWRYAVDPVMAARLARTGWQAPPAEDLPLAREVVEQVLEPYATLPEVAPVLHLGARVVGLSRAGFDKVKTAGREAAPFVLRVEEDGGVHEVRAQAVIDASGTWSVPNPLGADGLPAVGEHEHAAAIAYGIPDVLGTERVRYAGRRTLVVGAGHSAANVLLALAEIALSAPETRLVWAVRGSDAARAFGGGEADALPARGALGSALRALVESGTLTFASDFRVTAVRREGERYAVDGVDSHGTPRTLGELDRIVCATGQRPDLALTRELRVTVDPWLESSAALGPLIDPNLHSCGTVRPHGHRELAHPEPGFYTVGVKSYGRAPTFLMLTGFEQARSVVAAVAGDLAAADRVELVLPETGVCGLPGELGGGSACCGATGAGAEVPDPVAVTPVAPPERPREPLVAACCDGAADAPVTATSGATACCTPPTRRAAGGCC